MSKYIGTPVVNVSVDTVDVTGDITTTDTTPEVIIVNNTHEDTDGGREGKVTFKGQQSGGEETTLAQIQASHDGTSDDEKGDLIFKTNDGSDGASPTEAMRIDSSQQVAIGRTANVSHPLDIQKATDAFIRVSNSTTQEATGIIFANQNTTKFTIEKSGSAHSLFIKDASGTVATFAQGGNVGIGETSPSAQLHIKGDDATDQIIIENTDAGSASAPDLVFYRNSASPADNDLLGRIDFQGKDSAGNAMDYGVILCKADNVADGSENGSLKFYVASAGEVAGATDTEALTIVSPQDIRINLSADTSDNTSLKIVGGTSGYSSVQLGDTADSNRGMIQYNHSTDSMTITVDDSETIQVQSNGNTCFDVNSNFENAGSISGNNVATRQQVTIGGTGYHIVQRWAATPLYVNRMSTDGDLVLLYGQGTNEGSISVSGSTVSYNGGHLSRWSQLSDNTKDTSIVKGTVMTNLDKMAVWTHAAKKVGDDILDVDGTVIGQETEAKDAWTENNEQLNCMAVSSVEGDPNVAGVFVNWDEDDDVFTNDMNVAMTGDMVIRIAQGTTVTRGDLLMSAGDGTAKPQGDDIVRSKTIAKVTSTNVSHTYDDGSYLVPCVLMAC